MQGVAEGPAIHCTAMGYFPWCSDAGEILHVKCYFCQEVAETILSPTDIVSNHIKDFKAWGQHCDMDTKTGWIKMYPRATNLTPLVYTLYNLNNLWYNNSNNHREDYISPWTQPKIHRLTAPAQYELYHQRLGHPGERIMSIAHLHIEHLPPLRGNPFYKCASCVHAKLRRRHHQSLHNDNKEKALTPIAQNPIPTPNMEQTHCGQRYSMDFGFMKGSGYSSIDSR